MFPLEPNSLFESFFCILIGRYSYDRFVASMDPPKTTNHFEAEPNGVHSVQHETSTDIPFLDQQDRFDTVPPPPASPQRIEFTRNESMGDIMDISSSSSDEGEVTDTGHSISSEKQITLDEDEAQEDYEPELEIHALPTEPSSVRMSIAEGRQMHAFGHDPTPKSSDATVVSHASTAVPFLQESTVENSAKVDTGKPHVILTNTNDDEDSDYEPPEPDSPVDNQTVSVEPVTLNSEVSGPSNPSVLQPHENPRLESEVQTRKNIGESTKEVISFLGAYYITNSLIGQSKAQ